MAGLDPDHRFALEQKIGDLALKEPQIRLMLEQPPNGHAIKLPIGLTAGRAHRRAFAGIEPPPLDARLVGSDAHRSAQGIDLAHQVPLADPADRGIAAHLSQRFDRLGEQQGARAGARRGERRLGAGVATADHDHLDVEAVAHRQNVGIVNA